MGDCGSMFVGFFLASSALSVKPAADRGSCFRSSRCRSWFSSFPIFDTTLVTVMRKLWGREASQGGRDHTSHRLVALGMSERHAVLMLYGFAGLSGLARDRCAKRRFGRQPRSDRGLSRSCSRWWASTSPECEGLRQERRGDGAERQAALRLLVDVSYKRRIFEVLLDVVLITLSYWSAYAINFPPSSSAWNLFLRTLPVLVFIKMSVFLAMVFTGVWRYTSMTI